MTQRHDDSPIYTTGQVIIGTALATPAILSALGGPSFFSMALLTALLALMLTDGHENGVL